MSFTPAHIAQAKGPRARKVTLQDLIRVRRLYVEKRYKHCIAACEELQEQRPPTPLTPTLEVGAVAVDLHPVHRAFLIFHRGISYECMGLAAHKYSQNKLRFLESAQEQYNAALDILPQPFANNEDGRPFFPAESPDLRFGDESYYDDDSSSVETAIPVRDNEDTAADEFLSPVVLESDGSDVEVDLSSASTSEREEVQVDGVPPTPSTMKNMQSLQRSRSSSAASIVTDGTSSTVSQAFSGPNFDDYSLRQDLIDQDMRPAPGQTPRLLSYRDRLPRSTPVIDIGSVDSDSSEDEMPTHTQYSGLPRSMRSLNLAAHDFSSEDSDSTVATPSKSPAGDTAEDDGDDDIPETPLTKAMESLRVPPTASSTYTNRLSASLSSTHVLCEELVPSPLFKKMKKMAKLSFGDAVKPPRPLPRTPHSFHNHLSLLPARKTAVQTLISRFEGTIPSPGSSYVTMTPPASAQSRLRSCTPITPRFQMIHDTFDPSREYSHLQAYLTSRSLANYNSQLTAFRTCLLTASRHTAELLEVAKTLQQQHEEEKRAAALHGKPDGLQNYRLASMWLLSTPGKPNDKSRATKVIGNNNKTASPSRTRILARSESLRSRKKLPLRNRVEESEEKRAERIKKLRESGFRVTKERCGWKGEDYYEGFRRKVEIELGV